MTSEVERPLWLSVPAASGRPRFAAAPSDWRLISARPARGEVRPGAGRIDECHRPACGLTIAVFAGEQRSPAQSSGQGDGLSVEAIACLLRDSALLERAAAGCRPSAFPRLTRNGDSGLGLALDLGMSVHQLDLALSAGRHAVERAKLDGARLLVLHGVSGCDADIEFAGPGPLQRAGGPGGGCDERFDRAACFRRDVRRQHLGARRPSDPVALSTRRRGSDGILPQHGSRIADPYETLGRFLRPEHAALVGAALAGAQLGLPVLLFGASAGIAGELAARMNPTLCPWLRVGPTSEAVAEAASLVDPNACGGGEKTMCIPELGVR